jgi:type III pantothenate kinase
MRNLELKLIIDIGNSLAKVAMFKGKDMLDIKSYSNINLKDLQSAISDFSNSDCGGKIKYAILSSVGNYPEEFISFLSNSFKFIQFSHHTKTPVKNLYASPHTLGLDRLAAVVGASLYFKDCNLLVIDAGTCITYDFLTSKKEYLGGSISPGIDLRFKSLHTFTAKLPLVYRSGQLKHIGDTTEDAIRSGVLNGVICELDGIINNYKEKYPRLRVILTGGDVKFFDGKLKNDIFANSNLVLEGLNLILDYNIDE